MTYLLHHSTCVCNKTKTILCSGKSNLLTGNLISRFSFGVKDMSGSHEMTSFLGLIYFILFF